MRVSQISKERERERERERATQSSIRVMTLPEVPAELVDGEGRECRAGNPTRCFEGPL